MLEAQYKELEIQNRILEAAKDRLEGKVKELEELLDMMVEITENNDNVHGVVESIERWLINHHDISKYFNQEIVYGYKTAQKDVRTMIDSWRRIHLYKESRKW
jgi:hypothetical protein